MIRWSFFFAILLLTFYLGYHEKMAFLIGLGILMTFYYNLMKQPKNE